MTTSNYDSELTVLGLPAAKGRWLLIPLGMGVLLCLGTVYSWSIFRKPLETELGTGVGIAYGVPMAVVARWFPDKKGLAVGLTIIGFGLSPLITAPLANRLINEYSVRPSLRFLGIIFTIIIVIIAITMKLPPQDWQPPANLANRKSDFPANYPVNMLKSRSFYGLWLCYAIGALIGLSAIGISSPVAEEIIQIDPGLAASSVALFALFNGISRPLFGWLSDRWKPHYLAIGAYTLILIGCLLRLVRYLHLCFLCYGCIGNTGYFSRECLTEKRAITAIKS